jgi:hypothetical protein
MEQSAHTSVTVPGAVDDNEPNHEPPRQLASVPLALNLQALFHIFISYRVFSEESWVSELYRTLHKRSSARERAGAGIPSANETVFPKAFSSQFATSRSFLNRPVGSGAPPASENLEGNFVNVFWDKVILPDGRQWKGNGNRDGDGFVAAILQSIVFVPVLSCKSLGKCLYPNTDVDNVILELLLAKFLFEDQQANKKNADESLLWPCSVIFPIMGKGVREMLKDLSSSIFVSTNQEAFSLLKQAGYCPHGDMIDNRPLKEGEVHPWSVRSIVNFFVDFHDDAVVDFDLPLNPKEIPDEKERERVSNEREKRERERVSICDSIFDCISILMKPQFSLNPRDSMLHVYLCSDLFQDRSTSTDKDRSTSTHAAWTMTDAVWVSDLQSRVQSFALEQYNLGCGIPFAKECSIPQNFQTNELSNERALNVLSKQILPAVKQVDDIFGDRNASHVLGPVVKSLVFVPILSCDVLNVGDEMCVGSVARLSTLKGDAIEEKKSSPELKFDAMEQKKSSPEHKFLLELLLAKFFYEDQQAKQKNAKGLSPLWPCSLIFPILGRNAYKELGRLSSRIFLPTNKEAFRLLVRAGYCPKRDMIEDRPLKDGFVHPWSVRSIVSFFFKFQGKIITGGSPKEVDEEIQFCSSKIFNIAHWSVSSSKELQDQLERTNPLASELQEFLNNSFLGHISPLLIRNGIKSIRRLSQLDSHSMQSLSVQIANQFQTSDIDELFKLRDVVSAAQQKKESHSLNERLNEFVDESASWATALYSTCAVDILLRKPFYLFIMIVGSLLLFAVGLYLMLLPTVYTRTFPGYDAPQTYTHTSTSTAVLCFVGAVGLGPISIGCSYMSSPRKGRYALAYLFYLTLFFVQAAGFIADDANSAICQYLSLETTQQSKQNCIVVYAIAFAIRELYFFAIFLTVLFRQEYYWIGFDLGLCVVLSCNIFIYFYSQSSASNVIITIAVIIGLLGLLLISLHYRRKNIAEAQKECEKSNDAQEYVDALAKYREKHGVKSVVELNSAHENGQPSSNCHAFLNNSDLKNNWCNSAISQEKSALFYNKLFRCVTLSSVKAVASPVEDSNHRIAVRQKENDFERLVFFAESVNTPFHELIQSFCGSNVPCTFVASECKQFFKPDIQFFAKVHLGPIKSTQRAIEKVTFNRSICRHIAIYVT